MGNEVWEELNKEDYPEEVKERVMKFVTFIKQYGNPGHFADLSCGNKFIANELVATHNLDFHNLDFTIVHSMSLYDYYPSEDGIKKIDLNNRGNVVARKYDTVYLSHVMEHLENPINSLQIIKDEFMARGGRIIFAVPNGEYENKHRPFDKSIGHITNFNRFKMEDYLKSAGLRCRIVIANNEHEEYPELWAVGERYNDS